MVLNTGFCLLLAGFRRASPGLAGVLAGIAGFRAE
jgi:hypothetical protein